VEQDDDIKHERELREQWQDSHAEVHVAEREALRLASEDISRRLSEMNQFRAQLEKERGEYVPRKEYDVMAERIKVLEIARGEQTGKSAAYASIAGFIGIVAAIIGHYWK
jgi:hypothetical protein